MQSNNERHRSAAKHAQAALRNLEKALHSEDGLEWEFKLQDIRDELRFVAERLQHYSTLE